MEELCAGIKFMNKEHKDFFCRNLLKCRELDIYHMALIYCLGIDKSVREHFENVYDIRTGLIQTDALQEAARAVSGAADAPEPTLDNRTVRLLAGEEILEISQMIMILVEMD